MPHQKLINSFKEYQIAYKLHIHQPVFTVEEAESIEHAIGEPSCKNLFLKDKKKTYYLVSTLSTKRVNLKALAKDVGNGHFSFGNADDLLGMLGVIPGSVTPYGLINDTADKVTFLLDKELMKFDETNFHPLRNDMTVTVALHLFLTFFEKIGRSPQIIDIPEIINI